MRWALLVLVACADPRVLSGPCTDCSVHVHPPGILDPASDAFHGKELARRNWSFATCAGCHGDDFRGGKSGVSCVACHKDGPTACTTCHGAGPTSNAHVAHAGASVTCGECHVVPASWDAPGHIVDVTGPATVTFGARAAMTIDPADRAGPPTWDGATCSNVYCHGDALHAAGGTASKPRWDDPAPTGDCARCHGAPPPSHAQSQCTTCHPASAPHIDGEVQIGVSCFGGCHGSATSAAPPRDLSGNKFTTALGVGAHQAHLQSQISAPIACETCHQVPTAVDSPGHIDTPLPAEVNAGLGWDRTTQTCTAACHGPARPVWTSTGQVYCGTCHGIPPATPSHTPSMTLGSCASCHPTNPSEHVNGHVDIL